MTTKYDDMTARDMVLEFAAVFQPPTSQEFWRGLIDEEVDECYDALLAFLKEIADVIYVSVGYTEVAKGEDFQIDGKAAVVAQVLHMIPQDVVCKAIARVHESNMTKRAPDGTIQRRETDGKVLKGDHYQPADLTDIFQ